MKKMIAVAGITAALVGSIASPSRSADLAPTIGYDGKHVRYTRYLDWRDRCAWANHYCLYAWHGYVYHYPYDELAYAYAPRRHRR